jgi:type IV pilus assembly protein PilC
MIKAGIPLPQSLDSLSNQSKSVYFKKIIQDIAVDIRNGKNFSTSLGRYPNVFDNFFTGLVSVGEQSGTLDKNLEFLSLQMSKDYNLRNKIKGAMLYPGLVFAVTTVLGGFISIFILPQLVDFFTAFGSDLPLSTKVLLGVATFMQDYGVVFFISLFAGIFGVGLLIKTKLFKPIWQNFVLRVPVFGKIVSLSQQSAFCRNLGTLIQSGVPISEAINITSSTLSYIPFQNVVNQIGQNLGKGKSITDTLRDKASNIFPAITMEMISVGEQTGKLDESLMYLGDFFEEDIDNISKNLTLILEPFLLVFIGLIVGFMALAIIGPIYQLTGSIHR